MFGPATFKIQFPRDFHGTGTLPDNLIDSPEYIKSIFNDYDIPYNEKIINPEEYMIRYQYDDSLVRELIKSDEDMADQIIVSNDGFIILGTNQFLAHYNKSVPIKDDNRRMVVTAVNLPFVHAHNLLTDVQDSDLMEVE